MYCQFIQRAGETLGFTCTFCSDEETAMKKLHNLFFQIILLNPEQSASGMEKFLGNVRAIRGYERTPLLILVPENQSTHGASYLDKGADGFINKPFDEDQIYSHLNLYLRRLIYRRFHQGEYLKKDLNTEKGIVVLCSASKDLLEIPAKSIETDTVVVTNESDLFKTLYSQNVWIVFIGTHAKWALPLVGKIKNDEAYSIQVILLRSNQTLDNVVVDFFNQGGDDITSLNKPAFILSRQINSRIDREMYFKEKYINALTTAASKLPIRSEKTMQLNYGVWDISAVHLYHDAIPGGDFYEMITINDKQRILLIGDVMGKKWDAWFFSLAYLGYIRSTVRNLAYQNFNDPAHLLETLNEAIFRDFKISEVFTTLSVVLLDRQGSRVRFASAGALPAVLIKKNANEIIPVRAEGFLLGLAEKEKYKNIEIDIKPGDALFLFTDGYLDDNHPSEEQNKLEKFGQELLRYVSQDTALQIDISLKNSGYEFADDDRTLLCIRKV